MEIISECFIFINFSPIKVELPVTGQPPHRSLRAVLPHRAPRLSCAVQRQLCVSVLQQAWLLRCVRFYDFRIGYVQGFPHRFEACPVVALLLATLIEYSINRVPRCVKELTKHETVSDHSIVVEVAQQFPAQCRG